jgi:hypothetical protein
MLQLPRRDSKRGTRSARPAQGYKPLVELLEDLTLLSATWTGAVSNDWNVAGNWTGATGAGGLPGVNDDVIISSATNTPVVHSTGDSDINSLTSTQAINLTGGDIRTQSGGVTLNSSAVLTISGGAILGFVGGAQSISGNGSVVLGDTANNRISLDNSVVLTVANGVTISGNTGDIGTEAFVSPTGTLVVASGATAQANVSSGTLHVSAATTNNGTLQALNGGTLALGAAVTAGTITTDTGHSSRVTQSNTITGSMISGLLVPNGGGNDILAGVTVSATGVVQLSSQDARVTAGMTLNGTIQVSVGSVLGFGVTSGEAITVTGTGSIVLDSSTNNRVSLDNNVALTLGSGITVHGQNGNIGATFFVGPTGTLTVAGGATIQTDVAIGTLALTAATTNNGTLQALNGGTLALDAAGSGSGTITTDTGNGSQVTQNGVTVSGNTIAGEFVPSNSANNILSGVTIDATGVVDISGAVERVTSGLTLNGTINLKADSFLGFGVGSGEAITVSGTGGIVLDGNVNNSVSLDNSVALTLGAGITVSGQNGSIGTARFAGPTGTLVNNGTINDNVAGGTFSITPSSFTNNGTIQTATATSTVDVATGNFANFSGTTLTGGTYNLVGTFKFPGANIVTDAANIILDGASSLILDHNNTSNNGLANFAANAAAGSFTLKDGQSFTTSGSFGNAGSLTVDAAGGNDTFTVTGTYTQSGGSTTFVKGGALAASNLTVTLAGGTLQGTGTITGNVSNSGATVSPGVNSNPKAAGTLSIFGRYSQLAGGTLALKVGGTSGPGTNYDELLVSGIASLNGTITASIFNNYTPVPNDAIPNVMHFASVSGDFSPPLKLSLGNGLFLQERFIPAVNPTQMDLVVHQAPTANGQSVTVAENTATTITLTGSAPNSDAFTFQIATNPAHGTLSNFNSATGTVTYTPNNNYLGADSFTFTVTDTTTGLVCTAATVSITVLSTTAPTANPQSAVVGENSARLITLTGSAPNSDPFTFQIAANPAHGTLSNFNASTGAVTYTPNNNYTGADSFTFTVTDTVTGFVSTAATMSITVVSPPTANGQPVTVLENTPTGITLTGSAPNGDPLSFQVVSAPTSGALSGTAPNLNYTPNLNYSGPDSFTFTVTDTASGLISTSATVSITVTQSGGVFTYDWNGSVSTDWFSAANWTDANDSAHHAVPTAADSVVITGGNFNTVLTSPATVANVQMGSGFLILNATLTDTGNYIQSQGFVSFGADADHLQVAGAFLRAGGLFLSSVGTVELDGTSGQTMLDLSLHPMSSLLIDNTNPAGVTLPAGSNIDPASVTLSAGSVLTLMQESSAAFLTTPGGFTDNGKIVLTQPSPGGGPVTAVVKVAGTLALSVTCAFDLTVG